MNRLLGFVGSILVLLVLFASPAFSFELAENLFTRLDFGYEEGAVIGVGVMYNTQPYTDVDDQVFPVPLLDFQYKRFYADGTLIGFYLNDHEEFKISVVGVPRFWGYEPDDSSALVGMSKRGYSFDGGLRGEWLHDLFTVQLSVVSDLTGEHEGQEVSAYLKKELLDGGLTPRIGVRWFSEDLVDHYYGVRGTEVTATRPAYGPDSTFNFVAGATLAIPLGDDEKWAWVNDLTYQVLGDEIDDSPIVEDDGILTFVSGIVYRY